MHCCCHGIRSTGTLPTHQLYWPSKLFKFPTCISHDKRSDCNNICFTGRGYGGWHNSHVYCVRGDHVLTWYIVRRTGSGNTRLFSSFLSFVLQSSSKLNCGFVVPSHHITLRHIASRHMICMVVHGRDEKEPLINKCVKRERATHDEITG